MLVVPVESRTPVKTSPGPLVTSVLNNPITDSAVGVPDAPNRRLNSGIVPYTVDRYWTPRSL